MQTLNLSVDINSLIEKVDGLVWGWPLIILILCAGAWLTVRTGFVQIFHLGKALKYMVKNAKARKILKKVKKMRKKRDVCACVGVRVADNKISGSEQ